MLGLTFDKILILAVISAFVLGPQRLPAAAAGLGRFVRTLRNLAQDTTSRIREEVGPDFDDFEWTELDPRQYDPRRIIRDALTTEPEPEPEPEPAPEPANASAETAGDSHSNPSRIE